MFQQPEAGSNIGLGFKQAKEFKDFAGGEGVIVIANVHVAPDARKSLADAGVLFVENGALKYMGSKGTVITIASA
jgi:hypothetical protein